MTADSHIKNPVEWGADRLADTAHAMSAAAHALRVPKDSGALPQVRDIGFADLRIALSKGFQDLGAIRTDAMMLALIYPVVGIVLAIATATHDLLPLVFPLISGFALVGPLAGIGLYALSRRRERIAAGEPLPSAAPSYGAIVTVGLVLVALFFAWLAVAYAIYGATLGPEAPQSVAGFVRDVLTTGPGWMMIIAGTGAGFVFAVVALAIGVLSFPLMLDRPVGPLTAMRTSMRAVMRNPAPMAAWGAIVAVGLVIGSIPALVGLVIVIPVLGHATWHLYRRIVPRA